MVLEQGSADEGQVGIIEPGMSVCGGVDESSRENLAGDLRGERESRMKGGEFSRPQRPVGVGRGERLRGRVGLVETRALFRRLTGLCLVEDGLWRYGGGLASYLGGQGSGRRP